MSISATSLDRLEGGWVKGTSGNFIWWAVFYERLRFAQH